MSLKEIRNFDYAVLLCADLKQTRAFYRDVMGFPLDIDLENWVSFRVGATLLTLRPRTEGPPVSPAVQLAFRVPPKAFDACHAELVAHNVSFVRGPMELPDWRHRAMFFRDPEGNVIEIYAEY